MMDKNLFKQKYLGEVTLKNGQHVKYLFPVNKNTVLMYNIESKQIFSNIQKHKNIQSKYFWALLDDLSLIQFQIVYAATKVYGDNYWKLLWENRSKK